jgi:hypothetical protein
MERCSQFEQRAEKVNKCAESMFNGRYLGSLWLYFFPALPYFVHAVLLHINNNLILIMVKSSGCQCRCRICKYKISFMYLMVQIDSSIAFQDSFSLILFLIHWLQSKLQLQSEAWFLFFFKKNTIWTLSMKFFEFLWRVLFLKSTLFLYYL